MASAVTLLPTCAVDTVAPDVGVAVVRVLRRLGLEVSVSDGATCCGQPAWNAGFVDEAAKVARTTLNALAAEPAGATICVPAGSCATMIRVFWPELFHVVGDGASQRLAQELAPRVREFSELVAEQREQRDRETPGAGAFPHRVAYHHSCHMLRELRIHDQPLDALDALEGCKRVAWDADERCCGFGGLFSVKQPETSVAMADDKLDALAATEAEVLVGCDQSCLLQLEGRLRRRGDAVVVRHLAQVLDDAAAADAAERADR